jgi:hypothetical protein
MAADANFGAWPELTALRRRAARFVVTGVKPIPRRVLFGERT